MAKLRAFVRVHLDLRIDRSSQRKQKVEYIYFSDLSRPSVAEILPEIIICT